MTRFLHTSDWHLGITRRFLGEETQARFTQARFEAIRAIGAVAREEGCRFIVVAGDVFDSNQVDRKTVARALECLGALKVPIFVLPANHDALSAGSIYRARSFLERKPPVLHVIESTECVEAAPGVDVVGAPWTSKRPGKDLAAEACLASPPRPGRKRVLLAHGAVDVLFPDAANPAAISLAAMEAAIQDGIVHYVALGDRHSRTEVGSTRRIWYSGTPEPTDFDEEEPGHVLVADLETGEVKSRKVGAWRFATRDFDLSGEKEGLERLRSWLSALEDKDRTVLKLGLSGAINLRVSAALDEALEGARDLVAAIIDRREGLLVRVDDSDFEDLALKGFARTALQRLRVLAGNESLESATARDAIGLLARLARRPE